MNFGFHIAYCNKILQFTYWGKALLVFFFINHGLYYFIGTYLQGLETTATYDATTEEFVLNTPKVTSIKWWPGACKSISSGYLLLSE